MLRNKSANLGEVTIAYREGGSGKALIFLHGNSQSKAIFRRFQECAFSDYHTFALDSRGHGKSTCGTGDYTLARFAGDVESFCDKLGIKEVSVIGYSDGGTIALALAARAPNLVKKTVSVSPNYLVSGLTADSLKLIKSFRRFFAFLGKIGFNVKNALKKIDIMLKDSGFTREDLGKISSPVLLLYAEKDMIREDHIMDIAAAISRATTQKIPGSSHLDIMGKKAALAAMREFLA